MNTFPPACKVSRGNPAAGNTVSEVPKTKNTSLLIASDCDAANASSGNDSPKKVMSGL